MEWGRGCKAVNVSRFASPSGGRSYKSRRARELLRASGYGESAAVGPFYYAEDYHQQYLANIPAGYCGIGGTGISCPIGVAVAGWFAGVGCRRGSRCRVDFETTSGRTVAGDHTQPAILAEGLIKRFGKTLALDGFDLEVAAGTVLGLLGPNGA